MRARTINGMLSFWLFVSTFVWPHSRFQVVNSWLVALGVMAVVILAISAVPKARFLNAGLGAWLAATALLTISSDRFTSIHNFVVGLTLVAFAVVRDIGPANTKPYEEPAEPYGPSATRYRFP
jgi:hypothetical protein